MCSGFFHSKKERGGGGGVEGFEGRICTEIGLSAHFLCA